MSDVKTFVIKKGFDLKLLGKPDDLIETLPSGTMYKIKGNEFKGVKSRVKVKEGDVVKIGTVLFENKAQEKFKAVSPVAGIVKLVRLGERRILEEIVIEENGSAFEEFSKYSVSSIQKAKKDDILNQLYSSGTIALIRERPFSKIPQVGVTPKAIFVNGMNTGPFQVDFSVAIKGNEEAFQVGLLLLSKLTEGHVYLCLSDNHLREKKLPESILSVEGIHVSGFRGPHPAGNTSVHINELEPMKVGDKVWAVKAIDLILIGKLFLNGKVASEKIICVGGEGVKEAARKHYKVRIGASIETFLKNNIVAGEQRIISGDVLSGKKIGLEHNIGFYDTNFTVIPENREREFLGWMSPGFNKLSLTRAFASSLLGGKTGWSLDTNKNGSVRAFVATGFYDRVMPLDIYVDVLIKAVLANDFDRAIKLGILETDPEDFALCTFLCPSKNEIQSIIQSGLDSIEAEGI
jgi:Na+-transporting NADH:ubiquinone oxidoreductase subunit A